jgi:hypothetical protein
MTHLTIAQRLAIAGRILDPVKRAIAIDKIRRRAEEIGPQRASPKSLAAVRAEINQSTASLTETK